MNELKLEIKKLQDATQGLVAQRNRHADEVVNLHVELQEQLRQKAALEERLAKYEEKIEKTEALAEVKKVP